MFGIYKCTQFRLSSNYLYNKNCTIPYFINLISDRADFAVNGRTTLYECNKKNLLSLIKNYDIDLFIYLFFARSVNITIILFISMLSQHLSEYSDKSS